MRRRIVGNRGDNVGTGDGDGSRLTGGGGSFGNGDGDEHGGSPDAGTDNGGASPVDRGVPQSSNEDRGTPSSDRGGDGTGEPVRRRRGRPRTRTASQETEVVQEVEEPSTVPFTSTKPVTRRRRRSKAGMSADLCSAVVAMSFNVCGMLRPLEFRPAWAVTQEEAAYAGTELSECMTFLPDRIVENAAAVIHPLAAGVALFGIYQGCREKERMIYEHIVRSQQAKGRGSEFHTNGTGPQGTAGRNGTDTGWGEQSGPTSSVSDTFTKPDDLPYG